MLFNPFNPSLIQRCEAPALPWFRCTMLQLVGRVFALVVVGAAFTSPTAAQTAAQNRETVRLRFSVLAWEPIKQDIYYANAEDNEKLRIPSEYRSDLYRYEGPPQITFFRTRAGPDGETVRVPVARAEIDRSIRRPLFLFFPNREESDEDTEFRILTIDDSPDAFPPGSYRFFNLTDHRIAGQIADERFVLDQGAAGVLVRPSAETNRNLALQLAVENPGGWERKVSTRWLYRDNARHIVFLARDGERLAIRSIPQYEIPENELPPDE